ncbi:S-adenosyl-L-methionine-dependent methyltransferase [Ustulina deusta]|nr:S-adenosyl-L-methionine-dependent methyltransferase [Ustulina deusta]
MSQTNYPTRNGIIILDEDDCDSAGLSHLEQSGTLVEVPQRAQNEYNWQFLHVSDIYTDTWSRVILRGIRLTRNRNLRGMLPRMKNEVCALYDINKEDNRPEHIQAAVEILVTEVVRTRALSKTNAAFPTHRFDPRQWNSMEEIENKGVLVQRWKYSRYWPTPGAMATKRPLSGALVRLRSVDIEDEYFRVADDKLRNEFRGGIIRGGSSKGARVSIPCIDLDMAKDDRDAILTLGHNQKYTADDMFCGAGGASCGIRRAGLQLRVACDFDEAACRTYQENFPEVSLNQMSIFNFIELETSTPYADLLHISPPCQPFSPAHTIPGKNDEANAAALLACAEVLQKRRPRLSTSEQTFGLLFDRNEEFFNALVGQYTALGYSFSWDTLRFKEYRIPSTRRRLIWIASCPGEALPPFPMPTHAETGRELPAPVTLRSVLTNATLGSRNRDPLHNVEDMLSRARKSTRFPKKPYDDRCQIGTVTTSGSERAHPSGKRDFTLRELADIQGFPREHTFVGKMTPISRQIGNAFPPVVVEILYRHLRKWLLRQDRVVPKRRGAFQTTSVIAAERCNRQDIIIIDPVDEVVIASRSSKSKSLIIIDDDENEESCDQGASASYNEQNTGYQVGDAILIDESGDTDMIGLTDVVEEYPTFSRESSRTLSAESLPSLIEMEVDGEYNAERWGALRKDMEIQREEARAHHRSLFYQN